MRRIICYLLALFLMIPAFAAKVITLDNLPKEAKSFITGNFSNLKIDKVTSENKVFESSFYVVQFTNGHEVVFDLKGNWLVVDCDEDAVPNSVIIQPILDYITKNFEGDIITQIEQSKGEYNVELQSDVSLLFDKKGNFLKLGK